MAGNPFPPPCGSCRSSKTCAPPWLWPTWPTLTMVEWPTPSGPRLGRGQPAGPGTGRRRGAGRKRAGCHKTDSAAALLWSRPAGIIRAMPGERPQCPSGLPQDSCCRGWPPERSGPTSIWSGLARRRSTPTRRRHHLRQPGRAGDLRQCLGAGESRRPGSTAISANWSRVPAEASP